MRPAFPHRLLDTDATLTLGGISPTEKVIAFCRVLLATATFAIMIVDPKAPLWPIGRVPAGRDLRRGEPPALPPGAKRDRPRPQSRPLLGRARHGLRRPDHALHRARRDARSSCSTSSLSRASAYAGASRPRPPSRSSSPASTRCSSSSRAAGSSPTSSASSARISFDPIYLVALGYLIAYLGEHERRSKQKLGVMLDLTTAIRPGRAPGWALTHIMRRDPSSLRCAAAASWSLRDPESRRYFTWDMDRQYGRLKLGSASPSSDPFPLPFASSTEAFFCNTVRPARPDRALLRRRERRDPAEGRRRRRSASRRTAPTRRCSWCRS